MARRLTALAMLWSKRNSSNETLQVGRAATGEDAIEALRDIREQANRGDFPYAVTRWLPRSERLRSDEEAPSRGRL